MPPADLPPHPSLQVDKTERAQEEVSGLVSALTLSPLSGPSLFILAGTCHCKHILTIQIGVTQTRNRGSREHVLTNEQQRIHMLSSMKTDYRRDCAVAKYYPTHKRVHRYIIIIINGRKLFLFRFFGGKDGSDWTIHEALLLLA